MYIIKHRLYLLTFAPHLFHRLWIYPPRSQSLTVESIVTSSKPVNIRLVKCHVNTKSLLEITYTFCEYNLWIPSCNMVHPRFKCLHMSWGIIRLCPGTVLLCICPASVSNRHLCLCTHLCVSMCTFVFLCDCLRMMQEYAYLRLACTHPPPHGCSCNHSLVPRLYGMRLLPSWMY